jgi:polyisoprenoid-binding protein YceI
MTSASPTVTTYRIDRNQSYVHFAIKHLMIATARGRFKDLEGEIPIDESDPARSETEVTIQTASLDTAWGMRDDALRSDEFFDVERYPTITFRSTGVEKIDDNNWKVRGDLTMMDETRPVVLDTEFGGRGTDHQGNQRIGFSAKTRINRRDWGLNYDALLESGGLVVGNDVLVELDIEAVKQG